MSKPSFVYVTYIASTPEKVWQALTDPDMTEKYWFGYRVSAGGKAGDPVIAVSPGGKEVHRDTLLESDPPRRLSYSWHPLYKGMDGERPSRVTFTLEPFKTRSGSPSCTTISTKAARSMRASRAAGRRCCRASRASWKSGADWRRPGAKKTRSALPNWRPICRVMVSGS